MQRSALPYPVRFISVLIVAAAAVLSQGAIELGVPPLTVATGRLTFAALILAPLAWQQAEPEIRQDQR